MEELFRESADVGGGYYAVTLARYNAETGELVVEQQATGPGGGEALATLESPPPRQVKDTVAGRGTAIRYAVALADDWIGIVRGSVASA